ncbi:MAG TPA: ion transporter [Candidatus Acidoferrales bacterium]|nr:ion transporter [Candidatus Acidoferrales bacterium]
MLNDWVTLFLALLLVPVLLLEETSTDPVVIGFAAALNALIWFLFVVDFAVDMRRSNDREAYLASHWFDLALIVVSPPLFVPPELQALRVLRILRIARAFTIVGIIAERVDRPLSRNDALAILALLGAVVLAGGVLIAAAEPASIHTVIQGYAWTVATIVTAGHTEPVPSTAVGRAISSTVIVMGVGSFAALATSLATRR